MDKDERLNLPNFISSLLPQYFFFGEYLFAQLLFPFKIPKITTFGYREYGFGA
jgi:hypothetical protein